MRVTKLSSILITNRY